MCRGRSQGGRRCPACTDFRSRRGYARAKYAAEALRATVPDAPSPLPGDPADRTRAALTATWGPERGTEIAALVDQVPTLEDLASLAAYRGPSPILLLERSRPVETLTEPERLARRVAALYETEVPGRTADTTALARVRSVSVTGEGIVLAGDIVERQPTGQTFPAGTFQRLLRPPTEAEPYWTAEHQVLMLNKRYQGHRIGTRLVHRSENALIAAGITQVDLNAADKMGGYAWAMAGYGWRPGAEPVKSNPSNTVRSRLKQHAKKHGDPDGTIAAMLARLDDRSTPDTYPTPREIARLGWTEGASTWVGREVMTGAWWAARKTLTAADLR